jgi:tRNA pseudouridine55 synthase
MIGFLNINKSSGMTSHDVVNRVRKTLKVKHIGHGGTLDPMAVGVLPVAIGSACRLLRFLPHDKVYLAEVLLGVQTETDDIEGKVIARTDSATAFTSAQLQAALKQFVGETTQKPPAYSAIHHDGKRLYELARAGQIPDDIKVRPVSIDSIDLLDYTDPVVTIRITCGAGTYIRSIARDLGEKLGSGGCLQKLVREKSGPFEIESALSLDAETSYESLAAMIVAPQLLLSKNKDFLPVTISGDEQKSLRMGQRLPLSRERLGQPGDVSGKLVLAICSDSLIALCKLEPDGGLEWTLKPEVVVPNAE